MQLCVSVFCLMLCEHLNICVHLYCHICFALDVFTLKIVFLAHTVAKFVVRKAFDEGGRASGLFSEVRECQEW